MDNQTIGDIYANNEKIHENTKQLIGNLTDVQTSKLPDGEKWTIAQIVEHIAIVKEGMTKISGKLLNEAQTAGKQSNGAAILSDNFRQKADEARTLKFEAPDQIHPTGKQTIAESLAKMDETQKFLEKLRPLFESVECSEYRFPHPFMGELTAHEWLTLIGGHEARHLRQIQNLLAKMQ